MSVAILPISTEFNYDESQSGYVLSSFFLGYMCLQIPSGTIASKYGGKTLLTLGILLPSVLTVATPAVAHSLTGLIAIRIATGITEGVTYPALHALMGKWVPAGERSVLLNVMWSGAFLGSAITLPVAGALCGRGWRTAFYFYGIFGIMVAALFWLFTSDSPETHSRISKEEVDLIVFQREVHSKKHGSEVSTPLLGGKCYKHIGEEEGEAEGGGEVAPPSSFKVGTVPVPFARLLLCPPVLGCFVAHFCHNWSFYLLLTWLPKYLKSQLSLDLESTTGLAVIPYLACFFGANFGGTLADWFIGKGYRVAHVRKVAFAVGELVPALALIGAGFCTDATVTILLLTIAVGFSGVSQTGFACTPLDVAPHLSGVIMGMQNTLATIPGIVAPIVAGLTLEERNDAAHWQQIFYVSGAWALIGVLGYTALATDVLSPSLLPGYEGPWVCGTGVGRVTLEESKHSPMDAN